MKFLLYIVIKSILISNIYNTILKSNNKQNLSLNQTIDEPKSLSLYEKIKQYFGKIFGRNSELNITKTNTTEKYLSDQNLTEINETQSNSNNKISYLELKNQQKKKLNENSKAPNDENLDSKKFEKYLSDLMENDKKLWESDHTFNDHLEEANIDHGNQNTMLTNKDLLFKRTNDQNVQSIIPEKKLSDNNAIFIENENVVKNMSDSIINNFLDDIEDFWVSGSDYSSEYFTSIETSSAVSEGCYLCQIFYTTLGIQQCREAYGVVTSTKGYASVTRYTISYNTACQDNTPLDAQGLTIVAQAEIQLLNTINTVFPNYLEFLSVELFSIDTLTSSFVLLFQFWFNSIVELTIITSRIETLAFLNRFTSVCQAGYILRGPFRDVNECELGIATCVPFQKCFNTIGRFICFCDFGYFWNETLCQCTPFGCTSLPGFQCVTFDGHIFQIPLNAALGVIYQNLNPIP